MMVEVDETRQRDNLGENLVRLCQRGYEELSYVMRRCTVWE